MNENKAPSRKNPILPATTPTPGSIISLELESRGWSQRDLANIIDRPEQTVSEIIQGKKRITAETAAELAAAFGTTEIFWLNIEANYQISLARESNKNQEISQRSRLFSLAPIAEMLKRGWIKPLDKSTAAIESELLKFFKTISLEDVPRVAQTLFRSSNRSTPEDLAKLAWITKASQLASEKVLPQFYLESLDRIVEQLLPLTKQPRYVKEVTSILESNGIHFILLKHLPKTFIDGAVFYLEDRPVIVLSVRYDRLDYFWFTIFHELAHVKCQHGRTYIDEHIDEHNTDEFELEANHLAAEWLIPSRSLDLFVKEHAKIDKLAVDAFAEKLGRHPSIVVGRLQRKGVIGYSALRGTMAKVTPFLPDFE